MLRDYLLRNITISVLAVAMASCGGNKSTADDADMLAKVGNAVLRTKDLAAAMPYGLSQEDSIRFSHAFIRNWIDSHLISEIASRNIGDTKKIDEMTENYRNDLIMWEYRRRMYEEKGKNDIPDDSLEAYYNDHLSEFKTKRPLLKGIFLRVPSDAQNLSDVKKWYRSDKTEDIERIEKFSFQDSVKYEYFRDRWVDWEYLRTLMPIEADVNPDRLFSGKRNIELNRNGYVYLLSVADYIPVGEKAPFVWVKNQVKEMYGNDHRVEYDRHLRQLLFEKGLNDGDVVVNVDLGVNLNDIKNK
jgi:hypothetical protein